jgi:hypothetical protein
MGMIVLYGLAFASGSLGIWLKIASMGSLAPLWPVAFASLSLLAFVLGGLWWGAVARPETSLMEPLLCATLFMGMTFFLGLAHLGPTSLEGPMGLGTLAGWGFLAVFGAGFFLWGSGPPFLIALAFPQERGAGQGLFPLSALAFLSLAVGLGGPAFWVMAFPLKNIWLSDLSAFLTAFLIIWIWIARAPAAEEVPLRLWPTRSLGYWTDDSVHGQELLVYDRSINTLKPAAFLGAVGAGGAISLALWNGTPVSVYFAPSWGPLFLVPLGFALGALVLGPALARLASPMSSLGLNILLLSLFLAFAPEAGGDSLLNWLHLLFPLFAAGSLWPMAARIGVCGKGFFPFSLGVIDFWLNLGFLGGLLGAFLFTALEGRASYYPATLAYISLFAAYLALAPRFSWVFAGFWTLLLGALYYFL